MANDPRPCHLRRPALAEGRLAYRVLDKVPGARHGHFTGHAPPAKAPERASGQEVQRRAPRSRPLAAHEAAAYRIGKDVGATAPSGGVAPATMPEGTRRQLAYGAAEFGGRITGRVSERAVAEPSGAAVAPIRPGAA